MEISKKEPGLLEALIPIIVLMGLLALNVIFFSDDSSYGPNQISLIMAAAVGGLIAVRLGYTWGEIQAGIVRSINAAMPAILILLLIGALAGTWLLSGVVPLMVFYGLKILTPNIFLFAACIVCILVSLATGSSWTTIATFGLAMLGIGRALGLPDGVIAGAIISGAYFGDKVSPLSDTTNLAPAMVGTDLFTHIKYMLYTTIPSISISLIIFLVWGFSADSSTNTEEVQAVINAIEGTFNLSPLLLLVPAMVIALIALKVPPAPTLLAGALLGGVFALIFQPDLVRQVSETEGSIWKVSYIGIVKTIFGEIAIETSHEKVNNLLNAKGMAGMMNTIWLVICAMIFGGVMESAGLLARITKPIIEKAERAGSLVASTAGTCIFFNITAADQYIAIVVPGRMYAEAYREKGYKPELLSRTLEDAGTVTSVLIPWNTCGAYQTGVLGVSAMAFAPYCFFNIISPFMSVFFAYANIKIRKLVDGASKEKVDQS
ncbi:MAG TPA: Na+/H+ antiporter NhaC [Flavobacteriales bacterium]|nr:Na+/H+ antiporter NhaC [Flavobacteriales bacterium]